MLKTKSSSHAGLLYARQPPADHSRLDRNTGFVIAPLTINKSAGERQLIRSAVVLAEHFDRKFRRRRAKAVELRQPLFPRCHLSPYPLFTNYRLFTDFAPSGFPWVARITRRQAQAMNEVRVWYLWRSTLAACKLT
jgi:hypothetical protein